MPHPLIKLNPGDPITAEGLHTVLIAMRSIYEALNRPLGSLTINVKNMDSGDLILGAIVSLIPKEGKERPIRTAPYAGSEVKSYIVHQLKPGSYTVVAEAKGFHCETRQITIDETGASQTITIEMSPEELLFPIPDLFGVPVKQAIDVAIQRGFRIIRIIDVHGQEISPSSVSGDLRKGLLVLNQVPEPGSLFPKNTLIQINISAKAEGAELVKVPNLKGYTIGEAQAKLDASSLVLGSTSLSSFITGMRYMANTNTKETHSTVHPCAWSAKVYPEHRLFCETKPEGFKWCDFCFPEKADG
jgi:hypothetical protein